MGKPDEETAVLQQALASEDATVGVRVKRKSADRMVVAGVVTSIVAAIAYLALFPWGGSPDSKLALALDDFHRYQEHLERVCHGAPLSPGELTFQQTGIPPNALLHKRLTKQVKVSVAVQPPDSLLLTVTLPELAGEGIYSLWHSNAIPAGTTLRSQGKCMGGTLYWSRLESSLPEERLRRASGS
jgi:hypothetical protein